MIGIYKIIASSGSVSNQVTFQVNEPTLNVSEDCLPVNYSTAKVKYTDPWWRIGGHLISDNKAAADRALSIVKHYKLDEICYVDRPQPPMTYWLTNNQSPTGSFSGEDCIIFIPSTLQVKQKDPNWLVQSSSSSMLVFDNEQSAKDAINIIKYYGFDRQCYVDRPNSPMKYFRN